MKVIMVEPRKEAYVKEIGNELEDMQEAVNGYIQAIYPFDDPVAVIMDEEGKLKKTAKANRPIYDENGKIADVLYGPFFICGVGGEDFTDIPEKLIQKYIKMFPLPGKE